MNRRVLYFIAAAAFLFFGSVFIILFSQGFKFDFGQKTLAKTGTILVKSIPDGAKILLNGEYVGATNTQIQWLAQSDYRIKITKEGYFDWEKTVVVKEGYVSEVFPLLIPHSPTLSPLTGSGVKNPALSSNRDRIAFAKLGEKSGIYTLSLSDTPLVGILRANVSPLLPDTPEVQYSAAEKIAWSPDDAEMLLQMNAAGFYRVKLPVNGANLEATSSAAAAAKDWEVLASARSQTLAQKLEMSKELEKIATGSATPWSPDEKKFLFKRTNGASAEYWVYDGTEPLGISRERENLVFKTDTPDKVSLFWFSDSDHLIVVEEGTISLVEIDGGNKTTVYSGKLLSEDVFPTPAGDRLIILASFIDGAEPNLYAISLR